MTRRPWPALVLLALTGPLPAAERSPNIVLVFADDLGWKDVGYQGTDFYETPNIDRLAREGMAFSNAYASGGNCAPSRACLLSGQYTPRHSVYAVQDTLRGPKHLMRMVPVANKSGLAPSSLTLAKALKGAGYATGIFGKWHLAGPDGARPARQGFEVVMDENQPGKGANDDPKGVYSITKAACAFFEKNRDRPFFAYVAHHAVHVPIQARKSSLERFRAKSAGKQHHDAAFAACLYDLDDAVGILLKKLADLGLEKDTLVVFTSDNGAPKSSQEPLRGGKGAYYEGGIREPFLVRWPGVVRPGTRCDVPVINIDLFPTFLAAAGAPTPKGHPLDGESLVPLFKGEPSLKRQAIFWHFPGYLDNPVPRGRDPVFRTRPVSVIRKGDWKLHLYHEEWQLDGGRDKLDTNRAVEVYNLAADVGERNDVALKDKAKRDELLVDLLAWMGRVRAPRPTKPNPDYAPRKGGD
ncbi:MAG: sulfatase [Gemmataceae bacterium]